MATIWETWATLLAVASSALTSSSSHRIRIVGAKQEREESGCEAILLSLISLSNLSGIKTLIGRNLESLLPYCFTGFVIIGIERDNDERYFLHRLYHLLPSICSSGIIPVVQVVDWQFPGRWWMLPLYFNIRVFPNKSQILSGGISVFRLAKGINIHMTLF